MFRQKSGKEDVIHILENLIPYLNKSPCNLKSWVKSHSCYYPISITQILFATFSNFTNLRRGCHR